MQFLTSICGHFLLFFAEYNAIVKAGIQTVITALYKMLINLYVAWQVTSRFMALGKKETSYSALVT